MSEAEMKERFVPYGSESGDRAKGFQTRSLFGKGLRDVLFAQKFGVVKSVKGGRCAVAEFGWRRSGNGDRKARITINSGPKVTSQVRQALGIEETGTRVEFHLREDVHFPQHEALCERIRDFYMLRVINSSPNRSVVVETLGGKGESKETIISFAPFQGEQIADQTLALRVESSEFPVDLRILVANTDLSQGEVGSETREGGLLVLDENSNAF